MPSWAWAGPLQSPHVGEGEGGSGRSEVNLVVSKRENIMLCPRYAVHFYSLCFSLFSAVFCAFFCLWHFLNDLFPQRLMHVSSSTYIYVCVWACVCCKYFCRVCLMIFYCPRLHSAWQIPCKTLENRESPSERDMEMAKRRILYLFPFH